MVEDSPIRIDLAGVRQLPHADQIEAYRSFIERANARMAAARDGARASDPTQLVTVGVDAGGLVESVELGLGAAAAGKQAVEAAVLAAVRSARDELRSRAAAAVAAIGVDRGPR